MDFGDFYQATSHRTLRYAYGLTGDLQQAQDVTQEAYARAWQRWRQVSGYDNAEGWLRLVVNRLVQDWWRHLRVRSRMRLEPPPAVAGPSEDAVMLAAALKQLPKAQSRALALFYLLDLPVADIAAETGVSENTVRSWLARGRAGMADRLRDEADAAPVPAAQDVAESGRRRRRTRVVTTVTAAGLAVLVVLGIVIAVTRTDRPVHPVHPSPSVSALRPVGAAAPYVGLVETLIAEGRAFIAANDRGTLRVTALETETGRPLWTRTVPGSHAGQPSLSATAGALVVSDLPSEPPAYHDQITVLDAATGVTRWHYEFAQPDADVPGTGEYAIFTPAAAIIMNSKAGELRGLDWRTGQARWTLSGARKVVPETATDANGSVAILVAGPQNPMVSPTIFVVRSDGVLSEYAAATGRPTGRQWADMPNVTDKSFISRGKLYLVTNTELSTLDLGGDGPSVAYTAHPVAPGTSQAERLWTPQPCGGDAICLIDGGNLDEERGRNPYQLVMLRAGADPVTRDLDTVDWVVPVGDTVYLVRGAILDRHLRPIKPEFLATTMTLGVDGGEAVLVQDSEPDEAIQAGLIHFWRFDPATGAVVDLGGLTVESVQMVVGDDRLLAVTKAGAQLFATVS
jgi:RNA polymerase sigma factor (sigma-70 family)